MAVICDNTIARVDDGDDPLAVAYNLPVEYHCIMMQLGLTSIMAERSQAFIESGLVIGRVCGEDRNGYVVKTATHELPADLSGKLRFTAESRAELPSVGDWVAVQVLDEGSLAIIHAVVPRFSAIVRRAAGVATEKQIIAANVDLVFIIQGLDLNFNPRRLERYLIVCRESNITPVVLLSKADLLDHADREIFIAEAQRVAGGADVLAYSAKSGEGLENIRHYLREGVTVCIIGSSGVGKSTLINTLTGKELREIAEVREADSRGRHTTTRRQMIFMSGGAILIDTPGMRELGLWHATESLGSTFPEISAFAERCKFSDCTHLHEPHCAVRKAVEEGHIEPDRLESYLKLREEAEFTEQRATVAGRLERKRKEKILGRAVKQALRQKGRK